MGKFRQTGICPAELMLAKIRTQGWHKPSLVGTCAIIESSGCVCITCWRIGSSGVAEVVRDPETASIANMTLASPPTTTPNQFLLRQSHPPILNQPFSIHTTRVQLLYLATFYRCNLPTRNHASEQRVGMPEFCALRA